MAILLYVIVNRCKPLCTEILLSRLAAMDCSKRDPKSSRPPLSGRWRLPKVIHGGFDGFGWIIFRR
jgi:hypothetical protein